MRRDEEMEKGLISKALRPAERSKLDRLIASKLAAALLSRPLEKICHAIEAYMALDEEKKNLINLSEEEEKEINKIYTIVIALLNARKYIRTRDDMEYVEISWPFSEDEVPCYFSPWLKIKKTFWYWHHEGLNERLKALEDRLVERGLKRPLSRERIKEGYCKIILDCIFSFASPGMLVLNKLSNHREPVYNLCSS